MWRGEGGGEPEERFILRLEGVLDVFVELLVRAGGFGGVEVAVTDDVAVWS